MSVHNSGAAEYLFERARHLLASILDDIDEFNDIRNALVEMGYTQTAGEEVERWPVPELQLTGNGCTMVEDATALDGFLEAGPQTRVIHRRKPKLSVVS